MTSMAHNEDVAQRRRALNELLTGPTAKDMAAITSPGIAASDARWAAMVVAGYAMDAADCLSLLRLLGLVDAAPRWSRQ